MLNANRILLSYVTDQHCSASVALTQLNSFAGTDDANP